MRGSCWKSCSMALRRGAELRRRTDDRRPPFVHLALGGVEAAAVVDDPRGSTALLVDGQLRVEPLPGCSLVESVALPKPPYLHLRWCVHDEHARERRIALALV